MLFLAALTVVAVAGLVAAEWSGSRTGTWVFKPAASTGFVATAVAAGALDGTYGRIVFVALLLCWLGDVLLIPKDERIFRAGISSFLLGHVALVAAFYTRGLDLRWAAIAALLVVGPAVAILRWLRPHLEPPMRPAVTAYVTVISTMVAAALGTFAAAPSPPILAAALGFAVSDLSVARDRFVAPSFVNRAWGLPLYYAAVLLFATSVRA